MHLLPAHTLSDLCAPPTPLLSMCSLAGLVSKAAPTKADTMSLLSKYEEYDHYGKYDEPEPYRHGHAVHVDVPKYYYSSNKVAIKLFEKFRSKLRPQPYNPNTFQFT